MPFESIHNYYEILVYDEIHAQLKDNAAAIDEDMLDDMACVALNQLPTRYVRHNVDMVYYMTPDERRTIAENVQRAVSHAIDYVTQHRRAQ